jgi:hypothetical protein
MHVHIDCDETLRIEHGRLVTPVLSSVVYLEDEGGPTLVFHQRASTDDFEKGPATLAPSRAEFASWSFPRRGRVTFFPVCPRAQRTAYLGFCLVCL